MAMLSKGSSHADTLPLTASFEQQLVNNQGNIHKHKYHARRKSQK